MNMKSLEYALLPIFIKKKMVPANHLTRAEFAFRFVIVVFFKWGRVKWLCKSLKSKGVHVARTSVMALFVCLLVLFVCLLFFIVSQKACEKLKGKNLPMDPGCTQL